MIWTTKKLGEVCEVVQSIRPASVYDDDFLYIDIASVDPRRKVVSEPRRLKVTEAPGRARQLVRSGDSIFATTRPYLENIAFITDDLDGAIASTGFCVVSPRRDVCDPKFVFLFISSKTFIDQVLTKQKGASYPAVSDQDIFNIEIPLPPIAEQRKMIEKIEKQFAKIDEAARLRAESEASTAALLPAALHEIFSTAESKGWKVQDLGGLCDILDSKRKPVTRKDRKPGLYPYYGATQVQDYVADYIFDEPLVLLGEDGARWGANEQSAYPIEGKTWVNNHAHVLRPHRGELLDAWLVHVLNMADLSKHITGATVKKLNQEKMRNIKIPLPPLAEQKGIVKKLDALSQKVRALRELQLAQSADLKTLKQSILHEAFSGRV